MTEPIVSLSENIRLVDKFRQNEIEWSKISGEIQLTDTGCLGKNYSMRGTKT